MHENEHITRTISW